ncbi:MAG: xanthine dehydrogenase family protein subunit M [Clostridia bacterium]|nr:xanthine dehydrogenase family protein subunit M [Clostridia bacterium]
MRFEKYFEPASIKECCELLVEYGKDAKLLAGGTDLVPKMKAEVLAPKAVISLHKIPGLETYKLCDKGVTIGALMPLRKLSLCEDLNKWPALKAAAGHVSSMQIRNQATLGGNACNASPSADAVEGLMVYDAIVNIAGPNGDREVEIADFFKGPGKTDLKEGEFVVSFFVPAPEEGTGAAYRKFAIRGDTDISIVGAGARLLLKDGKIADARITLASVAPTPMRAVKTEEFLIGKTPDEETAKAAGKIARDEAKPISDPRASAWYRKDIVEVEVYHAILDAAAAVK